MENNLLDQKSSSTTFCEVLYDEQDNWIYGILTYINLEKNVAEVFIPSKYYNYFATKSTVISVRFLNETTECILVGSFDKSIVSMRKQALIIKIEKVYNFVNNRKYERFQVEYAATIKVLDGNSFTAVLRNISLGGTQFFTPNLIETNKKVNIKVFISPMKVLNFSGSIIRREDVNNGFNYAVQFEEIDEENYKLFTELLKYLSLEKDRIAKELLNFKKIKYIIYASIIAAIVAALIVFYKN